MSTFLVTLFAVITASLRQAAANDLNIQFFVVFSSTSPSAASVDAITPENLNVITKVHAPIFDQKSRRKFMQPFQVTFTSTDQDVTPLGIARLYSELKRGNFVNKSPFAGRRFIIVIGDGFSIQRAMVAIRFAFSNCRCPYTIFTYDINFFNHANVTNAVFQINQDRKTLVTPLLVSTLLHENNPRGNIVILIHDVTVASDLLFSAIHGYFNTKVLVTEDLTEDVVVANLQIEILPMLSKVLRSKTSAATFVVHVANSRSVTKIFAAASRLSLLGYEFVWIVSDRSLVIDKSRNGDDQQGYLKPPVKPYLLPQKLIALEADRKQLFEVALARLLDTMANAVASVFNRLRRTRPHRRVKSPADFFALRRFDVRFAKELFQEDGSLRRTNRQGNRYYHLEDTKYMSAVYVSLDALGQLRLRQVTSKTLIHSTSRSTASDTLITTTQADEEMLRVINDSVTSEPSDSFIVEDAAADDIFPHLLKVYISLGPPFLFENPIQEASGACSGLIDVHRSKIDETGHSSAVICDKITPGESKVTHRCCSGLIPDMIRMLAKDLKVDARIIFASTSEDEIAANTSFALDILHKRVADMVFTADPYLGQHMSSRYYRTVRFFETSYAMLVAIRRKEPSLFAFLSPFPLSVWTGIIVCLAPTTALAISQFEWHSPFGLNPWGRKRSTNYTLGSALNMVYALLFGHTIKTKCPKAWPSKWAQNFWAGFAIFVIASYTGNLAGFLTKRHESVEFENIFDIADSHNRIKVGVLRNDPIVRWLRSAYVQLVDNLTLVSTPEEGLQRLIAYDLDVIIGEVATLRYWQKTLDLSTGSAKLLPRTFAHRDLAPVVLVDSPLRGQVAEKMREYKKQGLFEQLINKNRTISAFLSSFGSSETGGFGEAEWARQTTDKQLTLSHANGLFLAMVFAIVACCFILVAEHLTFYCVVPKLRLKKRTSFWRGFTLMYFSQRLYRILNSEELLRPSQVMKEMLDAIKRLEFSRLFQKSARKKRFRKITIAEFVQQVKDEKEKTLPDIVVQTKGINRAKKVWKRVGSGGSSLTDEAPSSSGAVHFKKSFRSTISDTHSDTPKRYKVMSVQHKLVSTSTSSLSSLKHLAEERFKSKTKSVYDKKKVSFEPSRGKPHKSKSDASDIMAASTSSPSRGPRLDAITGLTAGNRWLWLKNQLSVKKRRERRETMLSVFKEEMDDIVASRKDLERRVEELCSEIEQVKRERDRLMLVQDLEQSSAV